MLTSAVSGIGHRIHSTLHPTVGDLLSNLLHPCPAVKHMGLVRCHGAGTSSKPVYLLPS